MDRLDDRLSGEACVLYFGGLGRVLVDGGVMTISQTLREIYASAPTGQRYIETLSFTHSAFSRDYYLVNDPDDWSFTLEDGRLIDFQSVGFRVELPANDGKGNQDFTIVLSNAGQEMIAPIEAAGLYPERPVVMTYRIYIDQDATMPQNNPPLEMRISDIVVTKSSISIQARRADILNMSFPHELYTVGKYPGLNR